MINWDNGDRAELASYLKRTQNRLIIFLRSQVPKVTAKDFQEVSLQAVGKQEAENMIDRLEQAAELIEQSQPEVEHPDVTKGIV